MKDLTGSVESLLIPEHMHLAHFDRDAVVVWEVRACVTPLLTHPLS